MRNKPKVPRLTPEVDTSTPSTSRPVTPDTGLEHLDFNLPGRIRPGGQPRSHQKADWKVRQEGQCTPSLP